MEKIKDWSSRITLPNAFKGSSSSSSSTPGSKLTKAFKFNKEHNVLSQSMSGTHDPFKDGPIFEEPSINKTHIYLHSVAGFFCFLALCTIGAVAGFQAKWFSVSGGTGFVLFLTIISILLTLVLVIVPIVYDRWDKLKRPAQFLSIPRSNLILHAFGTFLMLLSAFIVTISAWTAKGCKNADDDPHASLGDTYKDDLKQWCDTKKASAIFDWFSFGAWTALLILSALAFKRERKREPGFIPPTSDGISYSNVHNHIDDPYADKHEASSAPTSYSAGGAGGRYNTDDIDGNDGEAFGRASIDGYGGGFGRGQNQVGQSAMGQSHDETSRTMQLAYSDPYAQIRQNLMSPEYNGYQQQTQPQQSYGGGAGGMPNPPAYGGGYR